MVDGETKLNHIDKHLIYISIYKHQRGKLLAWVDETSTRQSECGWLFGGQEEVQPNLQSQVVM